MSDKQQYDYVTTSGVGYILVCENCNKYFCIECSQEKGGELEGEEVLCPDCKQD